MDWQEYFQRITETVALKSKDATQVGAILVGPDKEIRMTGFNGPPRGVYDSAERRQRPTKYLYASHAEQNLVAFCAREGVRSLDCTVYVTHFPCSACARSLIQAGVAEVCYGPATTSMPDEEFLAAETMFREAGVNVRPWKK